MHLVQEKFMQVHLHSLRIKYAKNFKNISKNIVKRNLLLCAFNEDKCIFVYAAQKKVLYLPTNTFKSKKILE